MAGNVHRSSEGVTDGLCEVTGRQRTKMILFDS